MLDYSINSIRTNICYFLESLDINSKTLEKILQLAISTMLKIISKRINHDTTNAIKNEKETLFLHIIDEVLKFDLALNNFDSKEFLISSFMEEKKFIEVWIAYEKLYIDVEIKKIFKENC